MSVHGRGVSRAAVAGSGCAGLRRPCASLSCKPGLRWKRRWSRRKARRDGESDGWNNGGWGDGRVDGWIDRWICDMYSGDHNAPRPTTSRNGAGRPHPSAQASKALLFNDVCNDAGQKTTTGKKKTKRRKKKNTNNSCPVAHLCDRTRLSTSSARLLRRQTRGACVYTPD